MCASLLVAFDVGCLLLIPAERRLIWACVRLCWNKPARVQRCERIVSESGRVNLPFHPPYKKNGKYGISVKGGFYKRQSGANNTKWIQRCIPRAAFAELHSHPVAEWCLFVLQVCRWKTAEQNSKYALKMVQMRLRLVPRTPCVMQVSKTLH